MPVFFSHKLLLPVPESVEQHTFHTYLQQLMSLNTAKIDVELPECIPRIILATTIIETRFEACVLCKTFLFGS